MHIDYQNLSTTLIYVVTFLIIFSESGVFFLFFLPGDSLLFALGLLANQGAISIWYIIPLLIVAAVLGNFLGYFLGTFARGGLEQGKYVPKIKAEHLHKAELFYKKHGPLAVLFARFIPVIRTAVPFFAGVVMMRRKTFSLWSVVGGACWITAVILGSYFFGHELNLQNITFLGTGVILIAVVATPVFIALINRFIK
jgi:membrane-associated protein